MTSTTDTTTGVEAGVVATYDPASGTPGVIVGRHLAKFQEFARVIAVSDLLPDGLKGKPGNVFMALMQGLDLGLRPMQALNLIDVIKGKPAMNAQGMRAQILSAGHRFRVVESTDERCVIAAHRKDWPDDEWPQTVFTFEQAKAAGLTGGENWKKYPADMLLARATTRMAKAYFSDVTNGLSSVEELLDVTAVPVRSLADVARERHVDTDTGEVVDAEVVEAEPTDEQIRESVLAAAQPECPACGARPAHLPSECPELARSDDAAD